MAREDTQFKVGHGRIEGSGIKKGQKQRSTEMVNSLFDFFEGKAPDLAQSWDTLNEKEQWDVFIKCLKFMVPTISAVSIEDSKTASSIRSVIMGMAQRNRDNNNGATKS